MIAKRVRITGRVQGVFFRAWTAEQARALKLSGWVRNCPDGSVEAHLQGNESAVERMIALLHDGPPAARVDRVEAGPAEPVSTDGFTISH